MEIIELSSKKAKPKGSSSASPLAEKLLKKRIVMLFGEINMEVAKEFASKMLYLDSKSDKPIKVVINSPGGHVESGDTIHDIIQFINSPVDIIGTGWVASAGVLIYLGAEKKRRYCLPQTRFMLHQPIGGMQGPATDIEIHAKEILKTKHRLNKLISHETGQAMAKVSDDTDRDYWLSAEEAKEYGIVHKIIKSMSDIKG